MGSFGRGILASCTGAGASMFLAVIALNMLEGGPSGAVQPAWAFYWSTLAGLVAAILALPISLLAWLVLRSSPVGTWSGMATAVFGGVLGAGVVLALRVGGLPKGGTTEGAVELLSASVVCGASAAACAWRAGFREEVRVR